MKHIHGELISDLRRGEGFITDAVNSQMDFINSEALTALEEQKNHVIIPLVQDFNIPYMDPVEARYRVYYNVCRELEKNKIKFALIRPVRWCPFCKLQRKKDQLDGDQCKKCGRDTFIPRDARHKILISFKTKEESDEMTNIKRWLNDHSI